MFNKKEYMKKYNKEYNKKYRELHKEELAIIAKEYYATNKEKIQEYKKNYYLKNKEKELQRVKAYYQNNKEKVKKYQQKYNKINKVKVSQRALRNQRNKLKTNINFRLVRNLRKRIWDAMKLNYKSKETMALLGCNIDFLRLYLQSKFQPGMSFSNYGKWHIDHITPCVRFDLSKESEQKICFHYTNLQPLWAEDNESKGAK